ncbi:putative Xaa-Pro aminopeptidase P [Amphibalanus amphitrite]|uniref:Putative Xaa-Pro aminopeptidase P n=1 Tax=Amphibalanus amphitrite TaxID=1232801 RepID=A0A6A4WUV2_AMPAM|nr:putative Xaa-Pro aminopeptidase P [Amphibalanus amphitrite]
MDISEIISDVPLWNLVQLAPPPEIFLKYSAEELSAIRPLCAGVSVELGERLATDLEALTNELHLLRSVSYRVGNQFSNCRAFRVVGAVSGCGRRLRQLADPGWLSGRVMAQHLLVTCQRAGRLLSRLAELAERAARLWLQWLRLGHQAQLAVAFLGLLGRVWTLSGAVRGRLCQLLAGLRSLLAGPVGDAYQPLDAYIVPMDDEHQTEYIAPQDRFIKFISGFSGSAALVAVTAVRAALWTDGRYFLQAEDQLDCNWYLMKEDTGAPELAEWLTGQLKPGARVGSDPKRMAALRWIKLSEKLKAESIDLVSVEINLIEHLWTEGRAVARDEPITVHPLEFAGRRWQDKVADVRAAMKAASSTNQQVTSLLVTQLDEVAWLFNLRGDDLPNVPGESERPPAREEGRSVLERGKGRGIVMYRVSQKFVYRYQPCFFVNNSESTRN